MYIVDSLGPLTRITILRISASDSEHWVEVGDPAGVDKRPILFL